VALENQPVFRAPSLPKMGKTTVSSSTFSNVAKSSYKPKLKSTKFQFKSPFQKQKEEKAEGLKTQIQGSAVTANVATTLGETNRILVEIQKQLALDFANRITEKKQLLELSRRTALKQKAVKKEAFVERGKERGPKIGALGAQILAPTKSIFDKIIEFLSLIATGIVINNAWKWLQDPANRQKLADVFAFLKTYWKEIIAGVVLVKLTGAALKVLGFLNTIRKIFKRLSGLGRPPKPPSPGGTKPDSGPGGGGCGPVTGKGGCLDQLSATSEVANNLARTLFATGFAVNYFKKFALKTATTPATSQPPIEAEAEQSGSPGNTRPVAAPYYGPGGDPSGSGLGQAMQGISKQSPFYSTKGFGPASDLPQILKEYLPALNDLYDKNGKTTSYIDTPYGRLIVGFTHTFDRTPQYRFISNQESENKAAQTRAMLNNPWIKTFFGAQAALDIAGMVMTGKPMKKGSMFGVGAERARRAQRFRTNFERFLRSKRNLSNRDLQKQISDAERIVDTPEFQRMLLQQRESGGEFKMNDKQFYELLESLLGKGGEGLKIGGKFSKGGTVGGRGSGNTDSVPAMLAPGEEVIRSSAANLFRPLLKDINDNAGRMWSSLSNSINLQKRNNIKQEDVNKEFGQLVETFNEYLSAELAKKEKEKAKIANATGGGTSHMHMRSSSVKPKPKSSPTSIKTYNIRKQSSKNGQPTIVNMPMPAMNLAGNQSPEAPNTNVQETSSTPINFSSFDSSNPYIAESLADYGIFV